MRKTFLSPIAALGLALALMPAAGFAADVVCDVDAPNGKNYMTIPDSQVSACLDAGLGNIGNGQNDLFLLGAGSGYEEIADTTDNPTFYSFTSDGTGVWSFDASAWDDWGMLAIGFKFGTGNTPDEWFVYQVITDITSGTFSFFDIAAQGGATPAERFSHAVLYGKNPNGDDDDDDDELPEPGTLALLGLGLIGLGVSRRRRV